VSAARALHDRVTAAGLSWDDLLVTDLHSTAEDRLAETDDPDLDLTADGEGSARPELKAEDLALIDRLLRHTVSAETREELKAFRGDIEDGEFTAMDRKYCKDLLRRLEARAGR